MSSLICLCKFAADRDDETERTERNSLRPRLVEDNRRSFTVRRQSSIRLIGDLRDLLLSEQE
jgi:hypothetical protein